MIIILKGGTSAEREVSLWTARSVADALKALGKEFVEIDAADSDWLERVQAHAPEVVLIALHGPFGEDGTVQRALEGAGIPYTGSDSVASSIAIDKEKTKRAVGGLGVPLAASVSFSEGEGISWEGAYPAVVKPNGDGSSFGVTIVANEEALQRAAIAAFGYGSVILVEEFISGTELTCGVIEIEGKLKALPLVEIRPAEEFFNFEAKYDATKCIEICPAEVPEEASAKIQELTLKVFEALGCRHYGRADWILRDGIPYFLEMNTLPGMTKTSLLPKELAAAGISYEDFIAGLVDAAR